MMMAHNVEEEKMFSYFDSYMLLKQDPKNSIKDVFKDKPELFKKFEKIGNNNAHMVIKI